MKYADKIKRKYNEWLFEKYGFERGAIFEKIPILYRLNKLFSPSIYGQCEGAQIAKWFAEGSEEGMKNHVIKINIDKLLETEGATNNEH